MKKKSAPFLLFLAFVLFLPLSEGMADGPVHPFSIADMMAISRITDPQVSPDGKQIVFSAALPRTDTNRMERILYLGSLRERNFRPITVPDQDASNPRWSPDGHFLYFLAPSSGTRQVWRMSISAGKMEAITASPTDIECFEPVPGGRVLILGAAVIPGKTLEQTGMLLGERKKRIGNNRIYERLPVRQWDQWRNGTRNHLFFFNLADGSLRDLMSAMDADCPARPSGSAEDFSISPDCLTIVFSAKDEGPEEAWST
ncbi:MAG: hypothetical protein PHN75_02180, partial [Syntrophales bacterium]|nr:hypothetical protein [Syntrophales bacterium]